MNAEATAEKRPAWRNISVVAGSTLRATYKYQGGIKIIMIFVVEVLVILVGLPIEHMVEVLAGICLWFFIWS